MAHSNWAKIYFQDKFAGILTEEPGGRCRFTYDEDFRKTYSKGISVNLATTKAEHLFENGLHPFFDNLVAEGWLAEIQARAISTNPNNRFELLMTFGHDLVGAVSVIDPEPQKIIIDKNDYLKQVTIKSKASMSGVQPKIFVYEKDDKFYPVNIDDYSTHIAKLPGKYPLIIENEYLCTLAAKILLAPDPVVELKIGSVEGIGEALLVKRFDRNHQKEKIHFEEFAQLLNYKANRKYDASYVDLANFMNASPLCSKIDVEKLFRRILVCILLGNTDAHLKNFAMFHSSNGLELTPNYDMVFSAYYQELSSYLALGLNNNLNLSLGSIKAKHLEILCADFELNLDVLKLAVHDFSSRLDKVYQAIDEQVGLDSTLKKALKEQIKKRWNGTFQLKFRKESC